MERIELPVLFRHFHDIVHRESTGEYHHRRAVGLIRQHDDNRLPLAYAVVDIHFAAIFPDLHQHFILISRKDSLDVVLQFRACSLFFSVDNLNACQFAGQASHVNAGY